MHHSPSVNYNQTTTQSSQRGRMVQQPTTPNNGSNTYNTSYYNPTSLGAYATTSRSPIGVAGTTSTLDPPPYHSLNQQPEGSGSSGLYQDQHNMYSSLLGVGGSNQANTTSGITPGSTNNSSSKMQRSSPYNTLMINPSLPDKNMLYPSGNSSTLTQQNSALQRPPSRLSNQQLPTSTGNSSQQPMNMLPSYNYGNMPNTPHSQSNYYNPYSTLSGYPVHVKSGTLPSNSRSTTVVTQPGSSPSCPIVVDDQHLIGMYNALNNDLQKSLGRTQNAQNYLPSSNVMAGRSYSPAYPPQQTNQHYQYTQSSPQYVAPPTMPPPQTVQPSSSHQVQPSTTNANYPVQPSTTNANFPIGLLIAQKYRLVNKIGNGAFGEVFLASTNEHNSSRDTSNNAQDYYAAKLEVIPTPQNGQTNTGKQQLIYEAKVISYLTNAATSSNGTSQSQPAVGIPRVFWFGTEGQYNIMVLELLGPSLESLFKKCNRKFTLKTVLMLAHQMIERIEYTHRKNFVHRDIKPDNFLMGRKSSSNPGMLTLLREMPSPALSSENTVYLIDFGLSKMYNTEKGHIPLRKDKHLTGTARYASLNNHRGYEQSRRDDLESLGYVLLYFLRGSLPWQGLTGTTKEDHYNNIYNKKKNIKVATLCKGFPIEFATFLNYTRSLKFPKEPDYQYLRNLFLNLFIREKFSLDYEWDWVVQERKQRSLEQSYK